MICRFGEDAAKRFPRIAKQAVGDKIALCRTQRGRNR